jgi:hypothetical protein
VSAEPVPAWFPIFRKGSGHSPVASRTMMRAQKQAQVIVVAAQTTMAQTSSTDMFFIFYPSSCLFLAVGVFLC